jgi:imidazolonepropionase-like amidohydrolase
MKRILLIAGLIFYFNSVIPQSNIPVVGISDERPGKYGLRNAMLIASYDSEPVKADVLIVNGRFEAVGEGLEFPEGTVEIDLEGKTIYPSFVEIYSNYGLASTKANEADPMAAYFSRNQPSSSQDKPRVADYWNQGIHENYDVCNEFKPDNKSADILRKAGFGSVITFRKDGIARGTSALVSLAEGKANKLVLKSPATVNYSFSRGKSEDRYPLSQFGSIALLRQMYLDAEWYQQLPDAVFYDNALEALRDHKSLPQVFEASNKLEILRADAIGDEFGINYIIRGGGDEYQLIDAIKESGVSLILPLKFPDVPKVKDPYEAASVPLSQLKHWEMGPANAGMVSKAGIEFSLTSDGLSKKNDFLKYIRKAVDAGLDKKTALKATTYTPAKMVGAEDLVGSIRKGMIANLLVTSGDLFESKCTIYQNWVMGKPYTFVDPALTDITGDYTLKVNGREFTMTIKGKPDKPGIEVKEDTIKVKSTITYKRDLISIALTTKEGTISLSGAYYTGTLKGDGLLTDGSWVSWSTEPADSGELEKPGETGKGERQEGKSKSDGEGPGKPDSTIGKVTYPFVAYGWEEKPGQETILFQNATVWTLDEQGKIENADVLVTDGKIKAVGRNLRATEARVIDATGMHVTPGIIDEHSHIALGGANEVGQAITSEVKVGDIIRPDDLSIYRQLSGGITAAHLLHGSANPIGGQSILIKHRWGSTADEMKIEGQVGFLKHALGENVKRSTNRFPNTRMGVEHIIRDAYQRAVDYQTEWQKYNALSVEEKATTIAPRRDLELDALVDVLEERSFITCHTYVQSEAMMIMRLAEDLGIKAHTLIHMNEGFKLADKIRDHGAAASVFADWWDYKYEVYEGINYNAATLVQQGALTCLHSDDREMGRRLNQEAAKTVKYGGVSEVDALKLVTLNPAKILHLDHRMGSIEEGKDADVVLWNGHPLSVYSRAKMTLVDGIVYFDEEKDAAMKLKADRERNRIIQKILKEPGSKPSASSGASNIKPL